MNNFNRRPRFSYRRPNVNKKSGAIKWILGVFVVILIAVVVYSYVSPSEKKIETPKTPGTPDKPETPGTPDNSEKNRFPIQLKGNLSDDMTNITVSNINNISSTLCFHGKCPKGSTCEPQTEQVILELTEDEFKTDGEHTKDFDNGYQINWKVGDSCDDFFASL